MQLEGTQNLNGNSNKKNNKSILKKSDSRDKREFRPTSNTTSGTSGLGSSIVRSYYGSDPERENLLDSCSSDNMAQDPETTEVMAANENLRKHSKHVKQCHLSKKEFMASNISTRLNPELSNKHVSNINRSANRNKVDVEKGELPSLDNQEKPQIMSTKLSHEELKSLTGPKLRTGETGKPCKQHDKVSTKRKSKVILQKDPSFATTAEELSCIKISHLNTTLGDHKFSDGSKTEHEMKPIGIGRVKTDDSAGKSLVVPSTSSGGSIIIPEDQKKVDEHLTERALSKSPKLSRTDHILSSAKSTPVKVRNISIDENERADRTEGLQSPYLTTTKLSSQTMSTRSPSKLPPYKKPSSNSPYSASASGSPQTPVKKSSVPPGDLSDVNTTTPTTPADQLVKTPLRIRRKVETSTTSNPSVPTVVTLNSREHPDGKKSRAKKSKDQSTRLESHTTERQRDESVHDSTNVKTESKEEYQYISSSSTILTTSSINTTENDKMNEVRSHIPTSAVTSAPSVQTSPKLFRISADHPSTVSSRLDETVDVKNVAEANGCLPLASSKEVQTSLLNITLTNTPGATLSTSHPSEISSSKSGRDKFERGHQLSETSASKVSDLETRKEVGKLIFKMGEELRDLSKKTLSTQKPEPRGAQGLDILQPHCSNPLCRHNCPSTAIVSVKSSPKEVICMCGRTMTMVSKMKLSADNKPNASLVSDVS